MLKYPVAKFVAEHSLSDPVEVISALGRLREFTRGQIDPDSIDFLWMVPQHHLGRSAPQPVAAVRISGSTMRIECPNHHTFKAMQILIECLIGETLAPKKMFDVVGASSVAGV